MGIKCPKCGHIANTLDIFCSKCGEKLPISQQENIANDETKEADLKNNNEVINNSINSFLNNSNIKTTKKEEFFNPSYKNPFSNATFNFCIFIIIILTLFSFVLGIFLNKQTQLKSELRYKNYISNPSLIPFLKEPKSYNELAKNLSDIESFLELYLKHSNDNQEKKEQIFINYLNEMDKLSHLTSENIISEEIKECSAITSTIEAQKCSHKLNKYLKNVGVLSYNNYNTVYLYPNNSFIEKKYAKYLSSDLRKYLKLKAKYNKPISNGLIITIPPKKIADKIADFENYLNKTENQDIKDDVEENIYNDVRTFIFTPEIYATTTQEMKKEFLNAYKYFITNKKHSALRPLIMSYLDKQKSYSEENFKNDYPYKFYNYSLNDKLENSIFKDIFAQLRIISSQDNSEITFKYIYNSATMQFRDYLVNDELKENEFAITKIDDNNNISFYSSNLSLFQELNVPKDSKTYIINSKLYIYNKNKLNIYTINFNGKTFNLINLSQNEISSIFPGVEIINIDSYPNYNIYLEKENKTANYIIISKHSQGWQSYILSSIKGDFKPMMLDNMFMIDSIDDVELSFHSNDVNFEETSNNNPTYRFIIHTKGQITSKNDDDNIIIYDEKTAQEQNNAAQENKIEKNTPKIMPKINNSKENSQLLTPPSQTIDPPEDFDD